MACDVLLIIAMIGFLLKYRKTMQTMLTAFLQMNTKNTGMQLVQADQIGRTYPSLCKAQPCRALLGYPFHNTAAHMEAMPTREGI